MEILSCRETETAIFAARTNLPVSDFYSDVSLMRHTIIQNCIHVEMCLIRVKLMFYNKCTIICYE